jgi:hypothetical protein
LLSGAWWPAPGQAADQVGDFGLSVANRSQRLSFVPYWRPNPVSSKQAERWDGLLPQKPRDEVVVMLAGRRFFTVLCLAGFSLSLIAGTALAQSGGRAAPPEKKTPAQSAKEGQKKIDEIAEAARLIKGPAGNPECVWLGRRVVSLLWRDDLDTALRHLIIYDRFDCPRDHIQAAFRCVVRQGNIDPKAQETLNGRVDACWLDPGLPPISAQAVPPAAVSAGGTSKR